MKGRVDVLTSIPAHVQPSTPPLYRRIGYDMPDNHGLSWGRPAGDGAAFRMHGGADGVPGLAVRYGTSRVDWRTGNAVVQSAKRCTIIP